MNCPKKSKRCKRCKNRKCECVEASSQCTSDAGNCCTNLPSGFAALGESTTAPDPNPFAIPIALTTVLSTTVDSPVARELRVTAHYSADAPGDAGNLLITFRVRVNGIDTPSGAPNGSSSTFPAGAEESAQFASGAIVRRYRNVPAGPLTVDLLSMANSLGAELDPVVGGASLLVEQFCPSPEPAEDDEAAAE